MSQIVNVPNCESNLGRSVKDFMYVESNKPQQLPKKFYQRKMNISFKEAEKQLDQELTEFFKTTELDLKSIKIYHSSHTLASCLKISKFKQEANGLSLVIFNFNNHHSLFHFTVCSKEDNFSRLEGRVYAKRKALHALKKQNINGLYKYPTEDKYQSSVNPFKIGNWVVKNHILKTKEKPVVEINPLKYQDEDKLLGMAKEVLSTKYNVDIESIRLHTQYIRFYKTALFSHGLVCTPDWFKTLNQEGKELISNGGYTAYAMLAKLKDKDEKQVFITFSRCSNEEAFEKSYGRKQCLINFIKDNLEIFSYKTPVDNMKAALVKVAEQVFQHAINVEIVSDKEEELTKV